MTAGRAFPARYRGRCAAECGDPIGVGDLVTYLDDELVHDSCAAVLAWPPSPPRRPDQDPCAACHMIHAGECL